jgi:hypothetical protein
MAIMQNRGVGVRGADAGVGDVSAAPDSVAVVEEFGLALVLAFSRLRHTHHLTVGRRRGLHHVFHHGNFLVSFEDSPKQNKNYSSRDTINHTHRSAISSKRIVLFTLNLKQQH